MACKRESIDQITLSSEEIARRMDNFKRAVFRVLSKPTREARTEQVPEQVIHVMRSMMTLTNEVLGPHNASAVLTRTEEDAHWGTQVYVRIACTDESQEQMLLETLVRNIKDRAALLRPEIVESHLDGTCEVRMRVPSAEYAKRLAWNSQKEQLRRPLLVAIGFGALVLACMMYLYRLEHAVPEAHDEV
jgi:hypothetical protein